MLLKDQVIMLKKAYEAATKHKQHKKKQIQKWGMLTKIKGKDIIA